MTGSSVHQARRPALTVVQPDARAPLDRFAGWLSAAGFDLDVIRPYQGDRVPDAPATHGLIVLGGKMSANDDAIYPWLSDLRRLLGTAVQQRHPTLGICLGGQLLAQACGGAVTLGDRGVEAGMVRLRLREPALEDPLFAALGRAASVPAMHGDMISVLPESATWLAESDLYPHQAFRVGTCAWGVQFHPEITPQTYAVWAAASPRTDAVDTARVDEGLEGFAHADPDAVAAAEAIATGFAAVVSDVLANA